MSTKEHDEEGPSKSTKGCSWSEQLSQYVSGKPISRLVVNHSGLNDISWMETVSLTWNLDISGNPDIKDLSALKKMSSLQVVTVSEDMRPQAEAISDDVGFSFNFV